MSGLGARLPRVALIGLLAAFHPAAALAEDLPAATDPPPVDAKKEAEQLFRAGVSLQKGEDFEAAIAAFQSSLRLFVTKSALFNLANCFQATHRYPEALATLERLEQEFGSELEEPMRGRVAIQRAELENLTGVLAVRVDRAGAEVRVDGKLVGTAPLEAPLTLTLGDHELSVSLPGFVAEQRRVNLAPRARVEQSFVLEPEAAPEPAPMPAPPPAAVTPAPPAPVDAGREIAPREHEKTAGWVLLGGGAVLLAAGGVTGVWALSVDSNLKQECVDGHCPSASGSDVDRLDTLTTTTNVLLGLGAVAAAGGALVLFWPDDGEARSGTRVGLAMTPGFVGARVGRGF